YKSRKAVDLMKENLVQAQQRVKDFSNLEQNGLLARNDLLKAELQASNTELSLLDAENNWQIANVNMDLMLGLPVKTQLQPDPNVMTITNAVNIGLGVSYNFASLWKTRAKVEGAEARAKQISATQEMMNDNVRLEVNRAYLNYLSSRKRIDVYGKAVEQANENYRIV